MTPELGILMDGGEKEFLRTVIGAMARFEHPVYVELGVAHGKTLRGVWDTVKSIPDSRAIGIELSEWVGWDCLLNILPDFWVDNPNVDAVILKGRSTEVLASGKVPPISCAFIDACHGKECVMADFEAVEKLCSVGSVVIFHDACEKSQGIDVQPHCGKPIGVRAALEELGLMSSVTLSGDRTRSGWKFLKMIHTANHCAVFEMVS